MGSFTRGRCAVGARIRAALQRRWVRYLLRVAFTTSVLALLLTRIDLGSVRAALQLADIRLLSLGLGLSLGLHYVWATQRSLGLGAVRADFSVAQLLKVILIAAGKSNFWKESCLSISSMFLSCIKCFASNFDNKLGFLSKKVSLISSRREGSLLNSSRFLHFAMSSATFGSLSFAQL